MRSYALRSLTLSIRVAISFLAVSIGIGAASAKQNVRDVVKGLTVADAIELNELKNRWNELLKNARTDPTPFSQVGIAVVAEGLVRIYSLPSAERSRVLGALKKGALSYLLSEAGLNRYCTAVSGVPARLNDPKSVGTIKLDIDAEVVHAATVLAALPSELPTLLDKLDRLEDLQSEIVNSELRDALLRALELRRARAALALVTAGSGKGVQMLRSWLGGENALSAIASKLPADDGGKLVLCRAQNDPWPSLPEVTASTRQGWNGIRTAFNVFFDEARDVLEAIEKAASDRLSPASLVRNTGSARADKSRAPTLDEWQIAYDFFPRVGNGERGSVDVSVSNEALGLKVPLGISIANVHRTERPDGNLSWRFAGDGFIQSVRIDNKEVQTALAKVGLPEWLGIKRVAEIRLAPDLTTITLDLEVIVAGETESISGLVLYDAKKPVDIRLVLGQLVDELAKRLSNKLSKSSPLIVTAWGKSKLSVQAVTPDRTVEDAVGLTVKGSLATPINGAPVEVELALGRDSHTPFLLKRAHISEGLEAAIVSHVNSAMDRVLADYPEVASEARRYVRRCLLFEGASVERGSQGEPVSVFIRVVSGGKAARLELNKSNSDNLPAQLWSLVKDSASACVLKEAVAFEAMQALQLNEKQVADYIKRLEVSVINLIGRKFAVRNVQRPFGKRGFVFDLVASLADGNEVRISGVELKASGWVPGAALKVAALDITAARLGPADIKKLVIAAVGMSPRLLERVDVLIDSGAVRITPHLRIEAMGGAIEIPTLTVGLEMSEAELRKMFLDAASSAIQKALEPQLAKFLPQLGPLKILGISAKDGVYLPVGDKDATLTLTALADLKYAKIRWDILIDIKTNGNSTLAIGNGQIEGSLLEDALIGELGKLLQGIAPGRITVPTVLKRPPYGVMFNLGANVGGFDVTLRNVRVTTEGVKLDRRISFKYDQPNPPVPLTPFQALPLKATIDLDKLADFDVGAFITVAGDSYGIIALDAELHGKGSQKRLETEAVVRIFNSVALAQSTGAVDFGVGTIIMNTKTVGELSKLLDVGDSITITSKPLSAEIGAHINALGIKAKGRLSVHETGGKGVARLGGDAVLLLGEAGVDVVLDSNLRGSGATGIVKILDIATGSLTVTPSTAQVVLDFRGFRIKLITPSVQQLTPELLKTALERVLDFKIDLDSLKSREIVISLVDSSGRPATDPIGGDPVDGKATENVDLPKQPSQNRVPVPPAVKKGGGDALPAGGVLPKCGAVDSQMISSPSKFPDHLVEVTEAPESYYYWGNSRVAHNDAWKIVNGLSSLACFEFGSLTHPYFEPEGYRVASGFVQVLIGSDDQPLIMVWRKNQMPVTLPIDQETRKILLRGAKAATLLQAGSLGHTPRGYARRLLRHLVSRAIAISTERVVDITSTNGDLLPALGIDGASGAIAMVETNGRSVLRVLLDVDNDDKDDPQIESSHPLFVKLKDLTARSGPLGQLVLGAYASGRIPTLVDQGPDCLLLTVNGVSGSKFWNDRLFVATSTRLLAVELVNGARTTQTLRAIKRGQTVCETILGAGGTTPFALSGGQTSEGNAAIAFGIGLGQPDWKVRLIQLKLDPKPPQDDSTREAIGSAIQEKLDNWARRGAVIDPSLRKMPLERDGQFSLLDALVQPESKYLDRILINPRGLL